MEQIICKQCLLRDMTDSKYYTSVLKYREALSRKNTGADDGLYNTRLAICTDCAELKNGVCYQCGCFVEMRAAVKNSKCPCSKW